MATANVAPISASATSRLNILRPLCGGIQGATSFSPTHGGMGERGLNLSLAEGRINEAGAIQQKGRATGAALIVSLAYLRAASASCAAASWSASDTLPAEADPAAPERKVVGRSVSCSCPLPASIRRP